MTQRSACFGETEVTKACRKTEAHSPEVSGAPAFLLCPCFLAPSDGAIYCFSLAIKCRVVFPLQMEITNDIQFLLPIMVAIMVAKWVGDFATHPLYHALLELKCIPFLDSEPVILHEGSKA